MTKPIARDAIYRRRLRGRNHRVMRALVHHVSAELSGPRRHDGRARIGRIAHDDPAVGDSVRPGIRKAVGSTGPKGALILAG